MAKPLGWCILHWWSTNIMTLSIHCFIMKKTIKRDKNMRKKVSWFLCISQAHFRCFMLSPPPCQCLAINPTEKLQLWEANRTFQTIAIIKSMGIFAIWIYYARNNPTPRALSLSHSCWITGPFIVTVKWCQIQLLWVSISIIYGNMLV